MVNAALDKPDGTVRAVVYPVVPGGEKTLRDLAKGRMATEPALAVPEERCPHRCLPASLDSRFDSLAAPAVPASGDLREALYRGGPASSQQVKWKRYPR